MYLILLKLQIAIPSSFLLPYSIALFLYLSYISNMHCLLSKIHVSLLISFMRKQFIFLVPLYKYFFFSLYNLLLQICINTSKCPDSFPLVSFFTLRINLLLFISTLKPLLCLSLPFQHEQLNELIVPSSAIYSTYFCSALCL